MPSAQEREKFFKKEKKVKKGLAKPAPKKTKTPWFIKRGKTSPKPPKEITYEVTYNVLKNMRGT